MNHIIDKLEVHRSELIAGRGTTLEQIRSAEAALDLVFSDDYRQYLLKYSVIAYDGHELTGICPDSRLNVISVTQRQRVNNPIPDDFYVVEETNVDGIVIWQDFTGTVYAQSPTGKPVPIANDLAAYLHL